MGSRKCDSGKEKTVFTAIRAEFCDNKNLSRKTFNIHCVLHLLVDYDWKRLLACLIDHYKQPVRIAISDFTPSILIALFIAAEAFFFYCLFVWNTFSAGSHHLQMHFSKFLDF